MPSTLTSYAPWTIMEHMFIELLTETTDINLTTELFPHQRISLFPSILQAFTVLVRVYSCHNFWGSKPRCLPLFSTTLFK